MKTLLWFAAAPLTLLAQSASQTLPTAQETNASPPAALAFELPPVLPASALLGPALTQGPAHRVRESVPTDGYMAHFTIDSDYGTFLCAGTEAAKTCLQEVNALTTLVNVSKSDLFAEGLRKSLEQPVDAVKHIITEPVESVKQLPKSVGHFFKKVSRSAQNAASNLQQRAEARDTGGSEAMTGTVKDLGVGSWHTAKGIAGFDAAKLDCAQQLGVDPYSDNERLQEEMEKVTWVFFSGGLPLRAAAMAASGGVSMALTATKFTGLPDEIYRLTPSELKVRNDEALKSLGVPEPLRVQFDIAPTLSVSQKRSIVLSLSAIGATDGVAQVIELALTCPGHRQAAFLKQSLGTLATRHTKGHSTYQRWQVIGRTLVATEATGAIHVAAPVDHVVWTEEVAEFAQRQEITALKPILLLKGHISETARTGFTAAGWQIQQELLN